MEYRATPASAFFWAIVVAIAASCSHTIHGLRKAVNDIRRLGQYTLEGKLGEGGMGVVYRASHGMLRRAHRHQTLHPARAGKDALILRAVSDQGHCVHDISRRTPGGKA